VLKAERRIEGNGADLASPRYAANAGDATLLFFARSERKQEFQLRETQWPTTSA
jgi:hypothetical protein